MYFRKLGSLGTVGKFKCWAARVGPVRTPVVKEPPPSIGVYLMGVHVTGMYLISLYLTAIDFVEYKIQVFTLVAG
jgi:hypothetical protein